MNGEPFRGFESHPLRQFIADCQLPIFDWTGNGDRVVLTRVLNADEFPTGRSENGAKNKIKNSYDRTGAPNREHKQRLRWERVGPGAAPFEQSGYLRQSQDSLQDKRDFPA